eukprot:GGOE01044707.1.p1 GENE.GGOE01044707.1~~GGOE01044707.1.p1  ORF type:complete len:263 (+),score=84.12 GGOE01044707.1:31-789(+)
MADHVIEVGEAKPLLERDKAADSGSPDVGGADSFRLSQHPNLRQAFLRRVYGVLATQVLLNALVVATCMYQPWLREFCLGHPLLILLGGLVPAIGCLIGMFFYKDRYPVNALLLAGFTLCESMSLGLICAMYETNGLGGLVLEAFGITLVVFTGLTLFTLQSKIDFSFLGAYLSVGLLALIVWGLLQAVFGWHQQWLMAWMGALVFCGFILFDTWLTIDTYSYDDYILAAVNLYLDFINLFVNILQLLNNDR